MLYTIGVFEDVAMPTRIICPHCHCPIDPLTLDKADSTDAQYRICLECDEAIVLLMPSLDVNRSVRLDS